MVDIVKLEEYSVNIQNLLQYLKENIVEVEKLKDDNRKDDGFVKVEGVKNDKRFRGLFEDYLSLASHLEYNSKELNKIVKELRTKGYESLFFEVNI